MHTTRMEINCLCVITLICIVADVGAVIPDYIKACYKTDPHINQCINSSIEALKPQLRTGIDELNVPGLEPLKVKELHLRRGPKGALFEATVNGLRAFGASDFTITDLESDLDANTFDAKLILPLIRFEGDYQLKMNILLFSVRGKGYLTGNFTNYRCDLHMKGHKREREGDTYLEFEKMKFKLNVGSARFHFSNLFNGDPVLASYVQVCKVSNPDYNGCILKSIESIRPRLTKGISKMRIPPLEPFSIPALEVNRNLEALNVKLKMKNIKAFGGSKFVINSFKADPVALSAEMSVTLPLMSIEADYDIDGRLLVIPLRGRGLFKGNFTNIKSDIKATGKIVTTNGVKHVVTNTVKSKTRIGGTSNVKLENTDGQNDGITDTANNFFNQNRQTVYNIIYPILDETADEIIQQISDSIMGYLPFDEILPK